MLHHFLLTRFALRLWQTDKNGRPIDYRVWLAERFALFERYTLPSVLSQDDQRFTWILLVERTSDESVMTSLREKMESYKHLSPAILPIYISVRGMAARSARYSQRLSRIVLLSVMRQSAISVSLHILTMTIPSVMIIQASYAV